MKRWFMPKNVARMACERNAAAISAPFSSHGGDFFLLHHRAGRSFRHFWCMFFICIDNWNLCSISKVAVQRYVFIHVYLSQIFMLGLPLHYARNEEERKRVIDVLWKVVSSLKWIKQLIMHVCIWHHCSSDIGVP
jgi:hypothetical protein